jgi:hypothetical protein
MTRDGGTQSRRRLSPPRDHENITSSLFLSTVLVLTHIPNSFSCGCFLLSFFFNALVVSLLPSHRSSPRYCNMLTMQYGVEYITGTLFSPTVCVHKKKVVECLPDMPRTSARSQRRLCLGRLIKGTLGEVHVTGLWTCSCNCVVVVLVSILC